MTSTTRARARVRAEALAALTAAAAIGAAAALAPPASAASPGYSYLGGSLELVALDLPAGALSGTATAVNDDGVVIGQAWDAFGGTGVVWRDGVPTTIPATMPLAVNDSGQVVGIQFPDSGPTRGVVWTDGTLTTLEPTDPAPDRYSFAVAIAADGTVVGLSGSDFTHATVWHDGTAVDLGTLGGEWSSADIINDRGQVAGISQTADGEQHAFLAGPGGLRDLGTLGGSYSTPVDINNRGQIVGVSETADGHGHAFLWDNGLMSDLGTADGHTDSLAVAINERGQVLVESHAQLSYPTEGEGLTSSDVLPAYPGPANTAFVWTAGQRQSVTGLGGATVSPLDFDDDGTVVGSATAADGVERPWLWSDGESHDLGGPAPLVSGSAAGINRSGLVVGHAGSPGGAQVPLLWRRT